MLTDEEIAEICRESNRSAESMTGLARLIERALLAKAMPIPKQEPDYWKIGGLGGDVITNKKSELDLAERFNWPVEPLYKHPLPAQAAAIPEYEIIGYTTRYLIDDCKKGHQSLYGSWLKEDCPKHDGVAIAVLSASTKPE